MTGLMAVAQTFSEAQPVSVLDVVLIAVACAGVATAARWFYHRLHR